MNRTAFALLLLLIAPAAAQHRSHPVADLPLHEQFYSNWYMPDSPSRSCCNKADCYPTEIQFRNGVIFARRREDGKWLRIPPAKIEQRRDNPDGRNHLCAPAAGLELSRGDGVLLRPRQRDMIRQPSDLAAPA